MKQLPTFNNQRLFDQAFTHRSYLNEAKEKIDSNERLEFLGDSILSFVISDYLFNEYKTFNEGTLTNLRSLLVNKKSLAAVARELDFGKFLKLSKGEEESKGRESQSLLSDAYEAFVGAVFLDQGITQARSFIYKTLVPRARAIVEANTFKDPKSLLQENIQAQKLQSPLYKVLDEQGPAHARVFTVGVFVNEKKLGEGRGKSKQEAEEKAARLALGTMQTDSEIMRLLKKARVENDLKT